MEHDDIITSPSAADIAGLERVYFARLIREGKGPRHQRVKAGTRTLVLILRGDLDAWMSVRGLRVDKPERHARTQVPGHVRDLVMARDSFTCVYCGAKQGSLLFPGARTVRMHIDHIVPVCFGGSSTDVFNLCCACAPCNSRKGARTPSEAGMELMFVPEGFVFIGNQIVPAGLLEEV